MSTTSVPLAAVLFVTLNMAPALHAQSLADVARKTEQERAAAKTPTKLYTNKDLTEARSSTTPGGADASAQQTFAQTVSADTSAAVEVKSSLRDATRDETYWKDRMRKLQAQLSDDQTFGKAAAGRIDALTASLDRVGGARRSAIESERLRATTELSQLTAAVKNDLRAIADLEEEGRRAGIPPSWLRF